MPTIGQKSVETKLKNLITAYEKAKTKQNGILSIELNKLVNICSCKCLYQNPIEQYGKISSICAPNNRIPVPGKINYGR